MIERKTPEAGQFASLLTLSGESGGVTTTVGGTVAAGEPRLVRLDDYWLDMVPAATMLVTRHHDRPGTMGRIGLMLGEADVNISAMHLARSAPRADAVMILAVDDDVPPDGGRGDPARSRRCWTCGRSGWGPTAERSRGRLAIPDGLAASLVLLRHGESVAIVEGRFQGRLETPLSPLGRRQAELAGARLARPDRPAADPRPGPAAGRDRPLPARRAPRPPRRPPRSRSARSTARPSPACGPSPGCSRSPRAPGRASIATRS